jgi:hypothetical protein
VPDHIIRTSAIAKSFGSTAVAAAADPSSRVLLVGIAGAIVAALAGAIEFSRREFH